MARTVVDPYGETWKVGRDWVPWRPRLRGSDAGDGAFDVGGALDFGDAGGLVVGLVLVLVLTFAFFVLWPLVAVALEIVLLVLGALVAVTGRVVLRRPWTVKAVGPHGRERRWSAVGWGASGELIDAVAAGIEQGIALPPYGRGHQIPSSRG